MAVLELDPVSSSAPPLPIGIDDLDPSVHGRFEVVFSANVLELVPDLVSALERMQSVPAEGGVQRHVCPNYAFPYEPHFFVPLPRSSRRSLDCSCRAGSRLPRCGSCSTS